VPPTARRSPTSKAQYVYHSGAIGYRDQTECVISGRITKPYSNTMPRRRVGYSCTHHVLLRSGDLLRRGDVNLHLTVELKNRDDSVPCPEGDKQPPNGLHEHGEHQPRRRGAPLGAAAQVEVESKFESGLSHVSFNSLILGAFNVCLIGSA
jgi:hypothetical protein